MITHRCHVGQLFMVRSRSAWSFQPESDIWRTVMEGLDSSAPCPFTTMCTATECFKAFAHRCTQRPRHPRNPIQLLHAPVFSAGMSHQRFQVSFRPRSSRIVPANDDWPSTTPWRWRPSVSPLPSPTSTSPLPVPSSGGTGSQPYPGPVQDGSDIVDHDLESDDS